MFHPKTDADLLEALLEAEIDQSDVLSVIDMWMNRSREDAINLLNPNKRPGGA